MMCGRDHFLLRRSLLGLFMSPSSGDAATLQQPQGRFMIMCVLFYRFLFFFTACWPLESQRGCWWWSWWLRRRAQNLWLWWLFFWPPPAASSLHQKKISTVSLTAQYCKPLKAQFTVFLIHQSSTNQIVGGLTPGSCWPHVHMSLYKTLTLWTCWDIFKSKSKHRKTDYE